MKKPIMGTVIAVGALLAMSLPASATIHEIVASFCATTHEVPSPTGEIHDPPGLTPENLGGTSSADNVAQPLRSSGAFEFGFADGSDDFLQANTDPAVPVPEGAPMLLVDEDEPQVKLLGSGFFFFDPGEEVWVEIGSPDPDFPAFKHCESSLRGH